MSARLELLMERIHQNPTLCGQDGAELAGTRCGKLMQFFKEIHDHFSEILANTEARDQADRKRAEEWEQQRRKLEAEKKAQQEAKRKRDDLARTPKAVLDRLEALESEIQAMKGTEK